MTAFIPDVNQRNDRDIHWYLERGKHLLNVPIPKVIFAPRHIIDHLYLVNPGFNLFVAFEFADIYLSKYLVSLNNEVITDNPKKDTIEYFMIQCNKTEWVRKSITLNPFKSNQFIWIDFGIYQFYEKAGSAELFNEEVMKMCSRNHNRIRIPSIWDINESKNIRDRKKILWFFAGSVFGGNSECLNSFSNIMRLKCLKMIEEQKTLVWEVNIWVDVFLEIPEIFDSYPANHDQTMIRNY